MNLDEKLKALKALLIEYGKVAVAYSSGVDSTFLLDVAAEVLGRENAIAVTVRSSSFPRRELQEALDFCKDKGISQYFVDVDELSIPGFTENPPERCYICKKAIFSGILNKAQEAGMAVVAEGSNVDDEGDYRPGLKAIAELSHPDPEGKRLTVISPLRQVGLTKAEIRELSKQRDLPTWKKPSFACLSTRFPYGEHITREKLSMVEQGEQLLMDLGFHQFRVRVHGEEHPMARIEVLPEEIERLLDAKLRQQVNEAFGKMGFQYVTLDMKGYRTGSMNETLQKG